MPWSRSAISTWCLDMTTRGNIDDTSDLAKPISTATQAALNGTTTSSGDGFGVAGNFGTEIYTQVAITRLA